MDTNYIVYKHQNKINHKIYIGITKFGDNPNLRWKNGFGYEYNTKFFNDIIKYGWDNFEHSILHQNLTEIEAIKLEKKYILLYNCVENGYNNNYGVGEPVGEDGRKKISTALSGKNKSITSIEKQMQTKKKRYGSERGISAYVPGKMVRCKETGDIFANISEANRWSHTTKVGECCNGKRQHAGHHPITNELLSWEIVLNLNSNDITVSCEKDYKKKSIQKIKCIETQKIYNSASEAERITGVNACNILRVCHSQRKTAGKLHWEFIKEME